MAGRFRRVCAARPASVTGRNRTNALALGYCEKSGNSRRFLCSVGSSREPADQCTEQQSGFRRKRNVRRHADEDPNRHADHGAHNGQPNPTAISGSHVAAIWI